METQTSRQGTRSGSIGTLLTEIADYHRKELTDADIRAWKQDFSAYTVSQVRAAWDKHRGESGFFPFVADLKKHLPANLNVGKRPDCVNPECMNGWVVAYENSQRMRYVKRCAMCHPHPDPEVYRDHFGVRGI